MPSVLHKKCFIPYCMYMSMYLPYQSAKFKSANISGYMVLCLHAHVHMHYKKGHIIIGVHIMIRNVHTFVLCFHSQTRGSSAK